MELPAAAMIEKFQIYANQLPKIPSANMAKKVAGR
jgi:hypothetical protein